MPVVSLLTDFGLRDGYVGVMKGVIWKICPEAQIADITHHIPPQDIRQGALALARTVKYFPRGTVHIAVVDPGVGTGRKPMAAEVDGHFFVGPDNGLFSLIIREAQICGASTRFFTLDRPDYWLPDISRVFHGRDIFAPAGAHLASGVAIEQIGSPLESPILLPEKQPVLLENSISGVIISIDNFGNLATNITSNHLSGRSVEYVNIGNTTISGGLVSTFGDRSKGELAVMIGTENDLVVAVVQGSASETLNVKPGDPVEVHLSSGKDQ